MDDIDKKILSLLQINADIPVAKLSKKVNLSSTPCWLRIIKKKIVTSIFFISSPFQCFDICQVHNLVKLPGLLMKK